MKSDIKEFLTTVKLNKSQKLWLAEVYKAYKIKEELFPIQLKKKLHGRIPSSFDPIKIDHRLLKSGYRITPLGIKYIDQDSKIFEKIEHVMRSLIKYFKKHYKEDEIYLAELESKFSVSSDDVIEVCKLLQKADSRMFHFTIDNRQQARSGETEKCIRFGDSQAIAAILKFGDIQEFVKEKYIDFQIQWIK